MAGAKGFQDVAVVLAALVGVFDQQANGGAGGLAFINARQNLDRIRLIALSHELGGARPPAVQVGLNIGLAQAHARRAAVNHAANGWAVGFTKVGDCE